MYSTLGDEFFQLLDYSFQYETFEQQYEALAHVFRRALNEKLEGKKISFAGVYPQLKYLIAEYHIPDKASKLLHTTRIRLHQVGINSEQLTEETLRGDLYAVVLLLYYLYPGSTLPARLKSLLPKDIAIKSLAPILSTVLRVEVSHFDAKYIYGVDVFNNSPVQINIQEQQLGALGRWEHFTRFLHPGSHIHVIHPRGTAENLSPELLIYEPDYLINISSIAACFRPEGASPYNYWVNKLQTSPTSWQIELGNLAGELLDLHVHHKDFNLEEVLLSHMRKHALVCSAPNIDLGTIESEARRQSVYIEETINKTLVENSPLYRREELLLEPSFYGQILGIEGRMDLLQRDGKLLIEQKSGKAYFFSEEDLTPKRILESHYIQILLYQAVLHYAFRVPSSSMETYLLYSKYPQPLQSVGRAPELLYKALALRNEIVWHEEQFRTRGYELLTQLTPNHFNTNGSYNKLWTHYTEPSLREFLAPFHTNNKLALNYFLRFSQSLQQEQALNKIGSAQSMNFGFASKWLNSYEERKQKGNIIRDLTLELVPDERGKYRTLLFRASPNNTLIYNNNFRVGDIVAVYPCAHNALPDVRRSIIFKGKITELGDNAIVVLLNHSQSSSLAFETANDSYQWVIESDINESSYNSQYQGLYAFLRCPAERQALLLMQRHPTIDPSQRVVGDYGEHQQLVLHAKQARDLFLILGPPGTGKTSYVLMNILREELLTPENNVLLSAFTNRAVNEICSKLVADGIDFIHLGTRLSAAPEYHSYLLEEKLKSCNNITEIQTVLANTRVFCGNSTLLSSQIPQLKVKTFSLAIIDEASQLLEPQLLPLFCTEDNAGSSHIARFILIGDHKQLPAIAQQTDEDATISDPTLQAIGLYSCKSSFFERFYLIYRNDRTVTHFLNKQARMHESIATFANYNFYQGRLITRGLPHQRTELLPLPEDCNANMQFLNSGRMLFLSYKETSPNTCKENVNYLEADLIVRLVEDYIAYFAIQGAKLEISTDIGIIVPYRMQIATIRNAMRLRKISECDEITIDTVERYQGSERKIVIYGFTAQTSYQLNFLTNSSTWETGSLIDRKLNVALTRAREHLVLVGNSALLAEDYTFYKLIRYCKTRGTFLEIDPQKFVTAQWHYTAPSLQRAKQLSSPFDAQLAFAYARHVLNRVQRPIKERMGTSLNALNEDFIDHLLGYGRSQLDKTVELVWGESLPTQITQEEQAVLWAYRYLPLYYTQSMRQYEALQEALEQCNTAQETIHFIEIGNNIVGALGLFRHLAAQKDKIDYWGVGVSESLAALGKKLLDSANCNLNAITFENDETCITELLEKAPASSTVILHFSCTFSHWSAERAATLARRLLDLFDKQQRHHYLICRIEEDGESERRSHQIFHKTLHYARNLIWL